MTPTDQCPKPLDTAAIREPFLAHGFWQGVFVTALTCEIQFLRLAALGVHLGVSLHRGLRMRGRRSVLKPVMFVTEATKKPDASGAGWLKVFEASWKPIAAIAVPVAVAVSPAIYKYYTFDRGVDGIIAEQALQILRNDPDLDDNDEISDAERGVRDWAISVIERYSQEEFPKDARELLQESASPISQTASNPEPLTQAELATALEAAAAVGNDTILKIAAKEVGVREVPGPGHNPRIAEYNQAMSLSFSPTDDDIPWNSQFLGWVVQQAGYTDFPNSAVSRSWEAWGQSSEDAIGDWEIGCIAVAWRRSPDSGTGIAGIYIGDKDEQYVRILAGNVFNAVDATTIARERVTACRLPNDYETIVQ